MVLCENRQNNEKWGIIFWGKVQNGIRSTPLYRCFQHANFDTPHGHHEFCMRFRPTKKIPMRFRTLWSCGRICGCAVQCKKLLSELTCSGMTFCFSNLNDTKYNHLKLNTVNLFFINYFWVIMLAELSRVFVFV